MNMYVMTAESGLKSFVQLRKLIHQFYAIFAGVIKRIVLCLSFMLKVVQELLQVVAIQDVQDALPALVHPAIITNFPYQCS